MANASHWASMLFAASGWRVVGGGTLHLHLLSRSLTMQQRQGEEAKGRDATMQASKKKALISRLQRQTHPPPPSLPTAPVLLPTQVHMRTYVNVPASR